MTSEAHTGTARELPSTSRAVEAIEASEMASRLIAYRSLNEWGDRVHHTICDEAADLLTRQAAEKAKAEETFVAFMGAAAELREKANDRAAKYEADAEHWKSIAELNAKAAREAIEEIGALKARVAELEDTNASLQHAISDWNKCF